MTDIFASQVSHIEMKIDKAGPTGTIEVEQIIFFEVTEETDGVKGYVSIDFKKEINLHEQGPGGMRGSKAPSNGFVALYAINSKDGKTTSLCAYDTTSSRAKRELPRDYDGHPEGYNKSVLLSVWPTDSNGNLKIGQQINNSIYIDPVSVFNEDITSEAKLHEIDLSSVVPPSATGVSGFIRLDPEKNTANWTGMRIVLSPTQIGEDDNVKLSVGARRFEAPAKSYESPTLEFAFSDMPVFENQKLYQAISLSRDAQGKFDLYISGYTI